uniref:(northern house mosquito) hypothetical protein n=1 Tax=Culex pipiens TaxID=7175 RepID=A0A8D8I0A4_CULPI
MLLDSLCAYLVFSCFYYYFGSLVTFTCFCVFVFVCLFCSFLQSFICVHFLYYCRFFFLLNICLCFAVHLTIHLSLACCSLFINSITNFRFWSSTICVFSSPTCTVLSFFLTFSLYDLRTSFPLNQMRARSKN